MNNPNIELTQDPLTNIRIMVPLLDDKGREMFSHLMLGYCISENQHRDRQDAGRLQES